MSNTDPHCRGCGELHQGDFGNDIEGTGGSHTLRQVGIGVGL